jgi:hypothetical protein
MPNRFDRVAKQIGKEALRASGATSVHEEITAETQYADLSHVPDPAREAERRRIGLLGRLAAVPCIFEAYSQAPSAEEFRACLAKHLAAWHRREREHRKRSEPESAAEPFVDSYLWIIAAGTPKQVLAALGAEAAPGWPKGIYTFGADVLRVGFVVASELPPGDTTTLLVRLMAAGPLLAQAAKEVAALPANAYERVIAEPALLSFHHSIGQDKLRPLDHDEETFMMTMMSSWAEARAEGRAEANVEATANAVLTVLRTRGIPVPDAASERIRAQKDLEQLNRWLVKAVIAPSIEDVIDDPS